MNRESEEALAVKAGDEILRQLGKYSYMPMWRVNEKVFFGYADQMALLCLMDHLVHEGYVEILEDVDDVDLCYNIVYGLTMFGLARFDDIKFLNHDEFVRNWSSSTRQRKWSSMTAKYRNRTKDVKNE